MSENFATILQTYLSHRDRELRLSEPETPYVWPACGKELAVAWRKTVSTTMSLLIEKYPDIDLDDKSESEGYVGICFEGKQFWVPAPLMSFLPDPKEMLKLYESAQEAKLFAGSRICLSGSTVLTGKLKSVGDLDLFEYVPEPAVRSELLERDPQYKKGKLFCTGVSVAFTNGEFPKKGDQRTDLTEDDIYHDKMRTFAAKYMEKSNFAKVDMIGMFNGQVGEVTNIAYSYSEPFDYGSAFPSFPFQEVSTGSQPPGLGAFSLKNFGKYTFWLRDEVEKMMGPIEEEVRGRPSLSKVAKHQSIKLAKRAMSLSAMLGDENLVLAFLTVLESRESRTYSLTSASDILNPLLSGTGDTAAMAKVAARWITKNLDEMESEAPDRLDAAELILNARTLVDKFDCLCYPDTFDEDK